ncbi:hypothetical protein E3P91_02750 [Wallemia ichthyophaga]|nr:hypothetical protein E3P91_02750 [Wallemia ichthyophaga]TIB61151.1 hypothetical protein E3P78_02899 [Wallemia ichthyophaga]
MSRRNNNNNVRGPTSALTSFLREQGITGPTGDPYRRQQREIQQNPPPQPTTSRSPIPHHRSDSEDLDDDPIQPSLKRQKSNPQIEQDDPYTAPSKSQSSSAGGVGSKTSCIECQSKVIITKYTPTGPDGIGVLCPKCTSAHGIDPFKQAQSKPKPKKPAQKEKRIAPKVESSKPLSSLADYSIKVIIANIDYVENLGEIGGDATDTIAKVLSKNRSLNYKTVQLFLGSHQDTLSLYDAANLNPECLKSIATLCPSISRLKIAFAGQLNNDVIKDWCLRFRNLQHLDVHGAYLVKSDGWIEFLNTIGSSLQSLRISECPHFDQSSVEAVGRNCKKLNVLSISQIKMENQGVDHLNGLKNLKNLEIVQVEGNVTSEAIVNLLSNVGQCLEELNLSKNSDLDNGLLTNGIRLYCPNLRILNLNSCDLIDNSGFEDLFKQWNNIGLKQLDISLNHVINDKCLETILNKIGPTIELLNLNKLKDISKDFLLKIPSMIPKIREVDITDPTEAWHADNGMPSVNHFKACVLVSAILITTMALGGIDLQFDRAVGIVQELPRDGPIQTNYEEKLNMYSLFKQATEGNVNGSRPSIFNMLERAKWDAWSTQKELSSSEAKYLYNETLKKVREVGFTSAQLMRNQILKRHSDKATGVELLLKLRQPITDDDRFSETSSDSSGSADNPSLRLIVPPSVTESDPIPQGKLKQGNDMELAWDSTRSLPQTYSHSLSKYTNKRIRGAILPSSSVAEVTPKSQDSDNVHVEDFTAVQVRLEAIEAKIERVLESLSKINSRQDQSSKLMELLKKMAKVFTAKKMMTAISLVTILFMIEYSHQRTYETEREESVTYIDDSSHELSDRSDDSLDEFDDSADIIDNQDWEGAGGDFTKQYNKLKNQVLHIKQSHAKSKSTLKKTDGGDDSAALPNDQSNDHSHPDQLSSLNSRFSQQINLAPYTKEKSKEKDKSDRATTEQVLDPRTRLILLKMINRGVVSEINGCLSTGKEANVYHGSAPSLQRDRQGIQLAIKIYKTSILVFKDRDRYVSGEFRFRKGYAKSNPRKMVRLWAEKEMRNLKRLWDQGLPCPQPIEVRENVLIMEFFGTEDGWASPRLKDAQIASSKLPKLYAQLMVNVRKMYRACRLVHADLSEYNILYHNSQLYIIDVSQSVEQEHPAAFDFLRSDLRNIENFFSKRGVETLSLRDSFEYVTRESLEKNPTWGERPSIGQVEEDQVLYQELQIWIERAIKDFDQNGKEDEKIKQDDAVFLQSYIPRTLDQVIDPERDAEKIRRGEGADLIYGTTTGVTEANERPAENIESSNDEDDKINHDNTSDMSSEDEGSDSESDSEDGDKGEWKERAPRGKKHEDKDTKKERKQAMKDEKREKRKTKIPKSEKKRKIKVSKGKR